MIQHNVQCEQNKNYNHKNFVIFHKSEASGFQNMPDAQYKVHLTVMFTRYKYMKYIPDTWKKTGPRVYQEFMWKMMFKVHPDYVG